MDLIISIYTLIANRAEEAFGNAFIRRFIEYNVKNFFNCSIT